jgi:hypothetical protein
VFVGAIIDNDGAFAADLPARVPAGMYLTATVTDPLGNTSTLTFGTLVSSVDGDFDGMPNAYETANGLNPGVDDAAGDDDGDGQSNLAESHAGTDPQSPHSRFGPLEIVMTPGGAEVTLADAQAGLNYRFDVSDDLVIWRPLAFGLVPAVAGPLTVLDPAVLGESRAFYRAVTSP